MYFVAVQEFENFLPVNEQSFTLEKLTVLFEEKVAKPFGFCYKLQLMSQNEKGRIYENTVVNNIYVRILLECSFPMQSHEYNDSRIIPKAASWTEFCMTSFK